MNPKQLRPLYGRSCHAVVRCHACGHPHEISARLAPGRLEGDVDLEGLTVPISDILSLSDDQPAASRLALPVIPSRFLPILWAVWGALMWLLLLARR